MNKETFLSYINKYIYLLHLYLNKKKDESFLIDDNLATFILKMGEHHSLKAITYKAIKETEVSVDKEIYKQLEKAYLYNVRKTILFDQDNASLYKYMNDKHISFLPLKGLVIRNYYPDKYDREYADFDILFDDNYKNDIKAFFDSKGYECKAFDNSNHDVYLKKPFYNYEMHRDLFAERSDVLTFRKYYLGILDRSPVKEGYEHYLSNEDFYIYFSCHSYKHYQNAGCGIRTLIDYYLFLKNNKLDFDYINNELEKLGLLEFSKEINELSIKLFDNEELTTKEKDILLYISSSGTYGTITHSVSHSLEKQSKFKYIFSRAFPPMKVYKIRYPRLYKTKILIPLAWFLRICDAVFIDHKRINAEVTAVRKHKKDK